MPSLQETRNHYALHSLKQFQISATILVANLLPEQLVRATYQYARTLVRATNRVLVAKL
jgi:hypothetical protein